MAEVVCERDEVCGRLQEVGEEGDSGCRARLNELDNLRNLDDGRGGDNTDSKAFRDSELEAFCVSKVDVEEEVLVACLADDGDTEVADRRGKIVGDGLKSTSKGVHDCDRDKAVVKVEGSFGKFDQAMCEECLQTFGKAAIWATRTVCPIWNSSPEAAPEG